MYHFSNVAFHLIASCLVFIFLKKLNYKKELAFFFSLIFLVHPALTQAVAWIPGRNDSMVAIFVLSSFIFLINYININKPKYFIWHMIFLFLALFTKETALFCVIPMIFYFYFINKERKLKINKAYWAIGWIFIIGFWFILRGSVLKDSVSLPLFTMIKSIFANMPGLIQIIGKTIFPFNLSVLPIIEDTTFIYGIGAILLLTFLIIRTKSKRWVYLILGAGWFLIFLFPSFIRPNTTLVADFIEHRIYLPIIGLFIVLLETDLLKNLNLRKKTPQSICIFILIVFFSITLVHSRNFATRLNFWHNAVKNSPHYPLAHRNLGAMEYLDGDMANAEKEFRTTLEINPNEEMAHNNLGLIYESRDMFYQAEKEYFEEIKINPYYDNVYANLGILYYREKKYDKAEELWKKALSINPEFSGAILNLTKLYYEQKRYADAKPYASALYKAGYQLPQDLIDFILK